MAPCRAFVPLQILKSDEAHGNSSQDSANSPGKAVIELYTGDCRQDFDPHRRHAEPDDLIVAEKQRRGEFRRVEAKSPDRGHQTICGLPPLRNPNVDVGCGSWMAVEANGVAADHEVVNAVSVQLFQKLAEVWR